MNNVHNTKDDLSPAQTAPVIGIERVRFWHFLIPILLVASAAVFFGGSWWIADYGTDRVPPQFFPRILAGLLAATSVLCFIAALRARGGTGRTGGLANGEGRAIASAAVLGATAIVIPFTGFYPAAFVGLALLLFISGNRHLKIILGTPVAILIFVYLVFDVALSVPLPELGSRG